jgi:hypothetical protein
MEEGIRTAIMKNKEIPPVGLLFYTRKSEKNDIPKIMSKESYEELQSYDFMLNRASYDQYLKSIEKEIQNTVKFVAEGGLIIGRTTFEKANPPYTRKVVNDIENSPEFVAWFEESAFFIESITGYKPAKITFFK